MFFKWKLIYKRIKSVLNQNKTIFSSNWYYLLTKSLTGNMRLVCHTQTVENRIYRSQLQSSSNCIFTFISLFCLCHTKRILFHTDKWFNVVRVLYNSLCCNLWKFFIKQIQKLESKVVRNFFQNWFTNNIQQLLIFLIINKTRKDKSPQTDNRSPVWNQTSSSVAALGICLWLHSPPSRLVDRMCQTHVPDPDLPLNPVGPLARPRSFFPSGHAQARIFSKTSAEPPPSWSMTHL